MKRIVSTSEMARICNVTSETIRRWIDSGDIPAFKTKGGHRRIDYQDFLKFVEQKGIQPHTCNGSFRKSVLLIGEDADYFEEEIISTILIPPNVHLEHAMDIFEAGYKLAVLQPDIIIVDPSSNGLDMQQMIKVIRRDPFTRDSVIFILSDRNREFYSEFETEGLTSYELSGLEDYERLENILDQL